MGRCLRRGFILSIMAHGSNQTITVSQIRKVTAGGLIRGALFAAILLIPLGHPTFASDPEFTGLPDYWVRFLHQERDFNVDLANAAPLSPEDKKVKKLYRFEVPLPPDGATLLVGKKKVRVPVLESTFSKSMSEEKARQFIDTERGIVSYFVLEDNAGELQELTQRYGPPKETLLTTRMSGRSTRLVWNPDGKGSPALLKMDYYGNDLLTSGVQNTDRIRAISDSIPIMREEAAVTIHTHGYVNSYLVRDASVIQESFAKGLEIGPLHGFISSGKLDEAARKAGLTRKEWITQEYLPQLARSLAENHFRHGIYFAAHTQNTLIETHPGTGRITRLVSKDLPDVAFDKEILNRAKKLALLQGPGGGRIINEQWVDATAMTRKRGAEAGMHFALYDAQSIFGLTADRSDWKRYSAVFLDRYLEQAEKLTQTPIRLSEENRKLLEAMRFGLSLDARENAQLNDLQSALVRILNDVHQQIAGSRMPPLTQEMFGYNQAVLGRIFSHESRSGNTIKLIPHAPLITHYAYDGTRIYQVDPTTWKPIAYAEVSEKTHPEFDGLIRKTPGSISPLKQAFSKCSEMFSWIAAAIR